MNVSDRADVVAGIPLFSGLPQSELERLASKLVSREFPPGAVLLHEGAGDERFYILLSGDVEVVKALGASHERRLAMTPRSPLLGEMSLFDPKGRHTATVRARTLVHALEMTRGDFDALLQRVPSLVYEMLRLMSRRLDETEHATIRDLREKNRQLTAAYQELQAAQEQLVEKEKLEKELAIARQIQESILPETIPPLDGFDIAGMSVPARAVGGDYYDVFRLGAGRLGLVVGDACDKGIPAALFINLTNSLVHVEAQRNPTPEATLRLVNQHLMEMNRSGMFATLLYGVLDSSGRLEYCRAGHPHPLVLDENLRQVETRRFTGMPLGVLEEIELDAQSVTIPVGGVALLCSDGLIEALDSRSRQLGAERVAAELPTVSDLPAADVCAELWGLVESFIGDEPQSDDFTVVVIKRVR